MLKEMTWSVNSYQMPRFNTVRWVPKRFRGLLPLKVMKRYQCVVVGGAHGVLTVAFIDEQSAYVIEGLKKLTGQDIFPVLVHPIRMRLLLQRIESCQHYKRLSRSSCYLYRRPIRSMLTFYLAQQMRYYR